MKQFEKTAQEMKYMDIWVANLPMNPGSHIQGGRRPVLVVSNDQFNVYSSMVTIVPLTSKCKRMDLPTHVMLRANGLRLPSVALCEQLQLVDKGILVRPIGTLNSHKERNQVKQAMAVQLGLGYSSPAAEGGILN